MSKLCKLTGKNPLVGNHVSHSNKKIKRRFLPNLQLHRFWLKDKNCYIKLKLSTKGMRLIDKYGLEKFLNQKNMII